MLKKNITIAILVCLGLFLSTSLAFAQANTQGRVVFGQSLVVSAGESINGDLAILGGSLVIENDGSVLGDVAVIGGSIDIKKNALVQGDVAVTGGSLSIAGKISGDVIVFGGSALVKSTGNVTGDVRTVGGTVSKEEGGVVQGRVQPDDKPQITPPETPSPMEPISETTPLRAMLNWFWHTIGAIGLSLALAALGLLAMIMFPSNIQRVADTTLAAPVATFGTGLLTLIVVSGISAILAITICLIPVSLLLLIITVVSWLLGWISIGWLIGQRVLTALNSRTPNPLLEVIMGIIIMTFLWQVMPCVGWLFWLIISSFGLGAVVMTRFGTHEYQINNKFGQSTAAAKIVPAIDQNINPREQRANEALFADLEGDLEAAARKDQPRSNNEDAQEEKPTE